MRTIIIKQGLELERADLWKMEDGKGKRAQTTAIQGGGKLMTGENPRRQEL